MQKARGQVNRMDDLISRQAAIDCEYQVKIINDIEYVMLSEVQMKMRKLPSAQPEIIRCKDCRHRIVNDHYGKKGYLNIKGYCELDTGDPFELGRDAQNDDWFCADAERRTG